jgi:hypothetical protein
MTPGFPQRGNYIFSLSVKSLFSPYTKTWTKIRSELISFYLTRFTRLALVIFFIGLYTHGHMRLGVLLFSASTATPMYT